MKTLKSAAYTFTFAALLALNFPAKATTLHWDPDQTAAGNDVITGAGLGGTGTWDTATQQWFDETSLLAWDNFSNHDAVFGGTAGTITIAEAMTARSLTFKVGGYTLAGESVNLADIGVIDCTGTQTFNNILEGGDLTKTGTGRLTLNGANSYSGRTLIYGGSVSITNDSGLGPVLSGPDSIVLSNATLRVTGASFALNSSRGITLDGTGGTIETSGSSGTTLTYAGNVSGEGMRLTKTGSRTYRATGNSSFSGGLTVSGGVYRFANEAFTLSAGVASQLGAYPGTVVSNYVILNGGTLRTDRAGAGSTFMGVNRGVFIGTSGGTIQASSAGTGDSTIYSGLISGTGVLTKTGPNELRYQGANLPNTTFSKLVVTDGLFRLGFAASTQDERGFGAVPAVFTPDAITLNGGMIGQSFNVTLHPNRGITLGAAGGKILTGTGAMVVQAPIAGVGVLKRISWPTTTGFSSGGTLTLNGVNTFSGGLLISNSTTTVASSGSLCGPTGPIEMHGGILNLNNAAQTVGALLGTGGTINLASGHVLTLNQSSNTTFGGVVAGTASLVKSGAGALTVTSAQTYTDGTTISGGSLLVNGGILGTGNITLENDGTLGGVGTIANVVAGNGAVAPGLSVGSLSLQNGVDLSTGGSLTWELGAAKDDVDGVPGTDFDELVISGGDLVLGGTSKIKIAFTDVSATPNFEDSFWQTTRKWTVVKLAGGSNPGLTGFASVENGNQYAGTFTTAVEPNGDVSVTFTPAGPTAPIVVTPPQNQTTTVGGNVTFNVVATGTTTLTYQWYHNDSLISGAEESSYSIADVQTTHAGVYSVTIANGVGSTSTGATLTVAVQPVIETQPQAQSVNTGENATFTVEATGGALTYQWKFNGANISGATLSSYTRSNVQTNHAGNYSVLVANLAGSELSTDAALTVTEVTAPVITVGIVGSDVVLTWTSMADRTYRVQYKGSLSDASWTDLVPDVPGTGSTATKSDPIGSTNRFYQVVLLP